jgi:hypothetical protein
MHKGCQTNHLMYIHTEETLHIKIQIQKTQQQQIVSHPCEMNSDVKWMLLPVSITVHY